MILSENRFSLFGIMLYSSSSLEMIFSENRFLLFRIMLERHSAQCARVDLMLEFEHARGERFFRVVLMHCDRILDHDRSGIHFRHDEMYGRAVTLHAGFKRAPVGVQPFELRQYRRMDVEHPPAPA